MKLKHSTLSLAIAGALALTLVGCGGSSSESSDVISEPVPVSASFSGTAAAGLPLVGTVTVKDALGATKTVTIGTNGAYTVDVTGMTAPFVFRAAGTVGGDDYVIHSGATSADINGNINITPLTDLIIANIAGDLAADYFNSGSFANLTPAEIASETDSLKAKLLPVLLAMGVDASIDLMRTQFTPLSSALDKALDVISISTDPVTNIATITNVVTEQTILDDIEAKAVAETTPPVMDVTTGVTPTASDDTLAVKKAAADFFALYATGLPAAATVKAALFDDAVNMPFRDNDLDATQFSNAMATDDSLVGASVNGMTIHKINYPSDTPDLMYPRAVVSFTIKDKNGLILDRVKSIQFVKGTDGVWKLRGNNRRLDFDVHSHNVKTVNADGSVCYGTGIELWLQDINTGKNEGVLNHITLKGPGLPDAGLKYVPPSLAGDVWTISGKDTPWYVMQSNCFDGANAANVPDATITTIADSSKYTVTAYTSADDSVMAVAGGGTSPLQYTDSVLFRPLTLTEAASAAFPAITSPSLADLASYSGGAYSVQASGMNPATHGWLYIGISNGPDSVNMDDDLIPTAAGLASSTGTLSILLNVSYREIRLETNDSTNFRNLMTNIRIVNPVN